MDANFEDRLAEEMSRGRLMAEVILSAAWAAGVDLTSYQNTRVHLTHIASLEFFTIEGPQHVQDELDDVITTVSLPFFEKDWSTCVLPKRVLDDVEFNGAEEDYLLAFQRLMFAKRSNQMKTVDWACEIRREKARAEEASRTAGEGI